MTTAEPADGGDSLFSVGAVTPAAIPVAGLRSRPGGDLTPLDAALAGDGYAWLAALLPASQPPPCEACGTPMRLPAESPVLWACPRCHPGEAA